VGDPRQSIKVLLQLQGNEMYLLEFSVLEEEGVGGGAVPVLHSHNYHALAGQVIADLGGKFIASEIFLIS
jgi:hypothetical protein